MNKIKPDCCVAENKWIGCNKPCEECEFCYLPRPDCCVAENDEHCGLVGSRIAFHAGLKFDKTAIDSAMPYVDDLASLMIDARHGEIICTAKVCEASWLDDSHSKAALLDCGNTPRFGLFLMEIEVVVGSGIIKGKQGIWNWEPIE